MPQRISLANRFGVMAFFGLLCLAVFGGSLAPHEPIFFVVEHGADPRPYDPGTVFPFGSDVLGRDLFSLVLAGARATLTIVLLAGLARVLAGIAVATVGGWWRPVRIVVEAVAEFASAVPATLVALVLIKVFVRSTDTSVIVFIGALLVTGWAGPYRVLRTELDRLAHAPFTEGAAAVGVGRWRLFWRHQLPHLVPSLAINLSQQIVASLVLLAELGVLGVLVGATRSINIEESLSRVENGIVNFADITDPPAWGGLLANARTIESLWTTRWLVLVPGIAFALTAIAVAGLGFAIARRYATRDVHADLRSRGALAIVLAVLAVLVAGALVPPRYASARDWAATAREAVQPVTNIDEAFSASGLRPVASSYSLKRASSRVGQSGPATVSAGAFTATEKWPRNSTRATFGEDLRSFVTAGTGGGAVEAPLVFAARGISPSNYPPPVNASVFAGKLPELGQLIKDYPDDYANIDVRGKVVLLVKFAGVNARPASANIIAVVPGIPVEDSISTAISHGAAAVLLIDPQLRFYSDREGSYTVSGPLSPYYHAEQATPPTGTVGVPVVLLSDKLAAGLASAYGIDLSSLLGNDTPYALANKPSQARDLGVTARVTVPLQETTSGTTSWIGEVGDVAHDVGHVLIWARRQGDETQPTADVLGALARSLEPRHVPFIFVSFDGSADPKSGAQQIRDVLGDRRVSLVVVLGSLNGTALKLTTPYGDLIPAFDLYARQADARAIAALSTPPVTALSDLAPFPDLKTVVIGSAGGSGDLRPDAAAFVGYLAGRLALGAEELPR